MQKNKYIIFQGDSTALYANHSTLLKTSAKLVYLDPPYNSKRNRGARKYYNDSNMRWSLFMGKIINNSYEILKDDGFLVISINQMELFNLKSIIDEYYTDKNFVGLFPVKIRHKDRQLMINATYHDVYEYILVYRKNHKQRFVCELKPPNLEKFNFEIKVDNGATQIKTINGKKIEIYTNDKYKIVKSEANINNFRRYIIAGKLKTGNWSGEWFENHLRKLGNNLLIKVHGLEKEGLGYRWFHTQTDKRVSGVYFQSIKTAGRPILPCNDLDYTDEVTNTYMEGGVGCDFKDSKKPEKLISWIMSIATQKNDLVVDLFGGSGTTLAVAIKKGRNCYIAEKHNIALNIIEKRIKNVEKEMQTQYTIEILKI